MHVTDLCNPFVPNAPILYPLKRIKKPKVYWYFLRDVKRTQPKNGLRVSVSHGCFIEIFLQENSEAVVQRNLVKNGVYKTFEEFTEEHLRWIFNGTPAQVFSGECCMSFKNTYFVQQERATVSETCEQMLWEGFEFKLTKFYLTKNQSKRIHFFKTKPIKLTTDMYENHFIL